MSRQPYRHLLVPTDGSKLAAKGVKAAVKLARALGAKVRGLYVVPNQAALFYGAAEVHATPALIDQFVADQEAQAKKALGEVQKAARAAGVPCAVETLEGDPPWKGMLSVARRRNCDLIVLASHGRGALGGLLLGSETSRVLSHTKRPVLVVR